MKPSIAQPAAAHDEHAVLSTSSRLDDRTHVLKQGETFAIFDRYGDIRRGALCEQGVYHRGTRHVSVLELELDGQHPLFLGSTVREDNALLAVDLANADPVENGGVGPPAFSVHVLREIFLWQGTCHHRFRVRNFSLEAVRTSLGIHFDADFADVFEVRGTERVHRGRMLGRRPAFGGVECAYEGLDGVERRTRFAGSRGAVVSNHAIRFEADLAPGAEETFVLRIGCEETVDDRDRPFEALLSSAVREREESHRGDALVVSSNPRFNAWLERSRADLHMMLSSTPHGPYPYAGVPWYSTPFGRDGIITALEVLWMNPSIARGVLEFLAATQADALDDERDAEPGKIVHEMREGEMASLGEIPFGRYYGTIDATPLFVVLAGQTYERTADRALLERLWPNLVRALDWLDTYGDVDQDGLVEYRRRSKRGLTNQGWKDSVDSVFHADGSLAPGEIALCEVQGYAYAAKREGARLARVLGHAELAARLDVGAERTRAAVESAFWLDDRGTYALALDGEKRRCRVSTSNAGHVLYSGLAAQDRAARVAAMLVSDEMFSGWGIRTVSAAEPRYNPMSYHNGSVWPHDNAICAAGLARYGFKAEALRVLEGLFAVSLFAELHRLPELFCGFRRREGAGPTAYPVACAPQAWAVAAPFLLLEACLGLWIDAAERRVCFDDPVLPPFLQELRITNLAVLPDATVDLVVERYGAGAGIEVTRRTGGVEVAIVS